MWIRLLGLIVFRFVLLVGCLGVLLILSFPPAAKADSFGRGVSRSRTVIINRSFATAGGSAAYIQRSVGLGYGSAAVFRSFAIRPVYSYSVPLATYYPQQAYYYSQPAVPAYYVAPPAAPALAPCTGCQPEAAIPPMQAPSCGTSAYSAAPTPTYNYQAAPVYNVPTPVLNYVQSLAPVYRSAYLQRTYGRQVGQTIFFQRFGAARGRVFVPQAVVREQVVVPQAQILRAPVGRTVERSRTVIRSRTFSR